MQATYPISHYSPAPPPRIRPRTVLLASSDRSYRQRLNATLTGLRWHVREAESGAQAWNEAETFLPEVVVVDSWLPDLELAEFLRSFRDSFPTVDVLTTEGTAALGAPRSPYRQELLYALTNAQEETAGDLSGLDMDLRNDARKPPATVRPVGSESSGEENILDEPSVPVVAGPVLVSGASSVKAFATDRLPELVGNADLMLDVSRRIRLVAPRSTPVLIEGPTGSGKELVAEGLHRLSNRSRKPFVAINCAAIPEALLEAELFGHTRGAFTGAVQGRTGRIEAADGGTLFLDEIGEMPLALQSKLLRFVECGELQRVGDNETLKVDVRVIAATHRQLAKRTQDGTFRQDLYYRLAVFLIHTPALIDHIEDLPLLVKHFLEVMGRKEPMKRMDPTAIVKLQQHAWPGNVRELEHVLERAAILAGDSTVITAREIDFGMAVN